MPQHVTAVLPSPLRVNASSPPYTVKCVAVERPAIQGRKHQLASNRLAVRRTPRQRDLARDGRAAVRARSADDVLEANLGFQRGGHRVERHTPGLIADNAIGGDLAPPLERLHRGFRMRPEVA